LLPRGPLQTPLPGQRRGGAPSGSIRAPGAAEVTIRKTDGLHTEISRGPAGDCCILCGAVAINLPDDHGCVPTVDPAALARPGRKWADLFDGDGPEVAP
jgi:hypothetical protein